MDLKQINEALNQYIRPRTFPVALKLCRSADPLPEKVRMPMRDLGIPPQAKRIFSMTEDQ